MGRVAVFLFVALVLLPVSFARRSNDTGYGYPKFTIVVEHEGSSSESTTTRDVPVSGEGDFEVAGIMVTLSNSGIDYVKEVLVNEILAEITPLVLPDIKGHVDTPIGRLDTKLSQILLSGANVSYSDVDMDQSSITIFAGDVHARIRFHWYYEYSASYVPWPVNDGGWADVEVWIPALLFIFSSLHF